MDREWVERELERSRDLVAQAEIGGHFQSHLAVERSLLEVIDRLSRYIQTVEDRLDEHEHYE